MQSCDLEVVQKFWDQMIIDLLECHAYLSNEKISDLFMNVQNPFDFLILLCQKTPKTNEPFVYGTIKYLIEYVFNKLGIFKNDTDITEFNKVLKGQIYLQSTTDLLLHKECLKLRMKTLGNPFEILEFTIFC